MHPRGQDHLLHGWTQRTVPWGQGALRIRSGEIGWPTAPAESAGSATQSVAAAPELSKEPSSVAASPPERAQPASESPAAALTVSEQASSVATAPAESSGSSGGNPVAASASPTPEPAAISSTDQRIGFPGPIGEYVDKLHEYCIQINRFNDPEPINLAYPVITHTHYM